MQPAPIHDPFTRDELRRDLAALREWSGDFWGGFDQREFFAALGAAWSPADNVRHLVKANRPVALALRSPRILLILRFGITGRPSRRYDQVVDVYRRALGGGLRAGRYAARPLDPAERTPDMRASSLAALDGSIADLHRALAGWSERGLDRLRLPHPSPAVGLLTVREMLLFTLYHNTHHVANVVRLQQERPRQAAPAPS